MVAVQQPVKMTQFQHVRAGLRHGVAHLRTLQCTGSPWVVFSDDDDVWHPRRVAEFVHAIRSCRLVDGVGSFVTMCRANVRAPELGQKPVPDALMPRKAKEVATFLKGRGVLHQSEVPNEAWAQTLRAAGDEADLLLIPWDLTMEYFDYCPRLRVVTEFFDETGDPVLEHRFCDLRFCEFLQTYPCMGREAGLEVRFFEPQQRDCWMYFYRNAGSDLDAFEKTIESSEGGGATDEMPASIGSHYGHVSAEIPVGAEEVRVAKDVFPSFRKWDGQLTLARLTRYFVAFHTNLDLRLVMRASRRLDQRTFDEMVFWAVAHSFGSYFEMARKGSPTLTSPMSLHLFQTCQSFAAELGERFEVSVLWVQGGRFLTPDFVELDKVNPVGQEQPQVAYGAPGPGPMGRGHGYGVGCGTGAVGLHGRGGRGRGRR